MWDTCTSHFEPKKIDRDWQGGSGKVKIGQNIAQNGPCFWPRSLLEAPKWVKDPGNGLKSTRGSWGAIWALGSISGVLDPFSTLYEQEHWPKGWYLKENWWVLPTRWVSVTAASTSPPTVPKGFYPSSLRVYWRVGPHARSNFPVVSNLQICLIL